MKYYILLKNAHVICAILTFLSFSIRGVWMLRKSPLLHHALTKIFPHVIDAALLATGVSLALLSHQYPFTHNWLTVKFFAVIVYIMLGSIALRYGRTLALRQLALLGAWVVFLYLAAVAWSRHYHPFS